MAHPKELSDDDASIENTGPPVSKRVIRQLVATCTLHDKLITNISIGFKTSRNEKVNDIPRKMRDILKRIQEIDGNAFLEANTNYIEDPTQIPDGAPFKSIFGDHEEIYRGRVYIGCKLHSTTPINQIKWSQTFGIMTWLKHENIHLDQQKYDKLAEASIGWIPNMNPALVLRSELKKMLDDCLATIPLKDKEIDILDELQVNGEQEEDTIYIPPYHIAKAIIGYGNGKERVSTSTYQIRCHPDHAQIFK